MSWFAKESLTTFQKFCINVIKCGPIPRHVAFIMDGNRRFASKTKVLKAEGHLKGFNKLAECLEWCRELEIREVTVYAFSIENFKRSQDEVETLMHLAREKFEKLLEEEERLMKEGVCIRVVGNLLLLPKDIQVLITKAMLLTKDNNKFVLNVAFSYTSRDEITQGVKTVVEGVKNGDISVEDVNEELLSNCLYMHKSPNPDILIRTSGEVRLSDFLLWQIPSTEICFTDVLWPELSVWHLLGCVFKYQRSILYNREVNHECYISKKNPRVESFLEKLEGASLTGLTLKV